VVVLLTVTLRPRLAGRLVKALASAEDGADATVFEALGKVLDSWPLPEGSDELTQLAEWRAWRGGVVRLRELVASHVSQLSRRWEGVDSRAKIPSVGLVLVSALLAGDTSGVWPLWGELHGAVFDEGAALVTDDGEEVDACWARVLDCDVDSLFGRSLSWEHLMISRLCFGACATATTRPEASGALVTVASELRAEATRVVEAQADDEALQDRGQSLLAQAAEAEFVSGFLSNHAGVRPALERLLMRSEELVLESEPLAAGMCLWAACHWGDLLVTLAIVDPDSTTAADWSTSARAQFAVRLAEGIALSRPCEWEKDDDDDEDKDAWEVSGISDSPTTRKRLGARYASNLPTQEGSTVAASLLLRCQVSSEAVAEALASDSLSAVQDQGETARAVWLAWAHQCLNRGALGHALVAFSRAQHEEGLRRCAGELMTMLCGSGPLKEREDAFQAVDEALEHFSPPFAGPDGRFPIGMSDPEQLEHLLPEQRVAAEAMQACPELAFAVAVHDWLRVLQEAHTLQLAGHPTASAVVAEAAVRFHRILTDSESPTRAPPRWCMPLLATATAAGLLQASPPAFSLVQMLEIVSSVEESLALTRSGLDSVADDAAVAAALGLAVDDLISTRSALMDCLAATSVADADSAPLGSEAVPSTTTSVAAAPPGNSSSSSHVPVTKATTFGTPLRAPHASSLHFTPHPDTPPFE
jgi:hypothetical protein